MVCQGRFARVLEQKWRPLRILLPTLTMLATTLWLVNSVAGARRLLHDGGAGGLVDEDVVAADAVELHRGLGVVGRRVVRLERAEEEVALAIVSVDGVAAVGHLLVLEAFVGGVLAVPAALGVDVDQLTVLHQVVLGGSGLGH